MKSRVIGTRGDIGHYPPGTVGVISADLVRYAKAVMSTVSIGLQLPTGSSIQWKQGPSITANMNSLVDSMIGEWIWFQADDHVFDGDALFRLLDDGVDIVAPIILRHSPPYQTVINQMNPDGVVTTMLYKDIPQGKLSKVHAVGTGGMLVRRRVFEAIPYPWFEIKDGCTEDIAFCKKARDAGFDIHIDSRARLGHVSTVVVYPDLGDKCGVEIDLGNGMAFKMSVDERERA